MPIYEKTNVELSDDVIALLRQPSLCFLATSMPDGSPQVTGVWGDTDGEHVVINSVQGHVKVSNIERDPRVAVHGTDADSRDHDRHERDRDDDRSVDPRSARAVARCDVGSRPANDEGTRGRTRGFSGSTNRPRSVLSR